MPVDREVPGREDIPRKWKFCGHEHRWPEYGVETDDVLPYYVDIGRPILVRLVAEDADVIEQRVVPHVRHLGAVEREWDTELVGLTGDGEVFEALIDELENFVESVLGSYETRVARVEFLESIGILGKSEEVVLLLEMLYVLVRVVGTLPCLGEVGGLLEGFTPPAVHSYVLTGVDIAVVERLLEDGLDEGRVAGSRGADEVGIADVDTVPYLAVFCCHFVEVFHDGLPELVRLVHDLLGILVDTGRETHLLPVLSMVARENVRDDAGVRVADVWNAVWVVDGGRDEESIVHMGLIKSD